jgi:hypothetical protein
LSYPPQRTYGTSAAIEKTSKGAGALDVAGSQMRDDSADEVQDQGDRRGDAERRVEQAGDQADRTGDLRPEASQARDQLSARRNRASETDR